MNYEVPIYYMPTIFLIFFFHALRVIYTFQVRSTDCSPVPGTLNSVRYES